MIEIEKVDISVGIHIAEIAEKARAILSGYPDSFFYGQCVPDPRRLAVRRPLRR
jgi:hypothetical protein